MPKENITNYSNEELSLYFLNEESLYNILQSTDFNNVVETANMFFIYTDEQLEELKETWENEQDE